MNRADDSGEPAPTLSEEWDPALGEPITHRIVRLVAIVSDRTPGELSPLGETIDVDALDLLENPGSLADTDSSIEISFTYEGFDVEVDADGTVHVYAEET